MLQANLGGDTVNRREELEQEAKSLGFSQYGSNISDEELESRLEEFKDQTSKSDVVGKTDKKPTKENKVERVRLVGGIAGMIGTSPRRALASKIEEVNQQGWYVRQVMADDTGNLLILLLRSLILCLTLFIYTPANGYLLILERDQS